MSSKCSLAARLEREILEDFPDLEQADIRASLAYAARFLNRAA
jgi:uncharacterized protein (DUF433 family)